MKTTMIAIIGTALIIAETGRVHPQDTGFSQRKAAEEILFEPIETIITASKREQRVQDSPSTISIITEEDIRESGALSIPDLLKFVPGIDVMEITSSHWEVNARGLNQLRSNKMLILIDGRSVYLDYFGGIIWEALPTQLEDIKRIEIIRGPVSALYGANAFSGVINIITKSPRESAGTRASAEGGYPDHYRATLIHGGTSGKLGYKFTANRRNINSWRDYDHTSEERTMASFKFDYLISGKSSLSFDAGIETGSVEQIILSSILKFDGTTNYAKWNYEYSDLKIQCFWNHGTIQSPSFVNYGPDTDSEYHTFDTEIHESFDIGAHNTLTAGGSFRYNQLESNILDRNHRHHLYAGFLQNEYRPARAFTMLLGFRVDHHPLVDYNFSPRGSLIYEPARNHTFRISAGQAYRNPTFTDSYLLQPLAPVPLPSPPYPPGSDLDVTIVGNEYLSPEKIQTYEFGYQTLLNKKARLKADFFYNKINEFIGTGNFIPITYFMDPLTGEPVRDPLTGMLVPSAIEQSFVNLGNAEAYGGEFDIDLLLNSWMRLRSNYTYLAFQNRYTLNQYQSPPQNKLNLIVDFSLPDGISLNLMGHYVDRTRWDIDTDNNSVPERHVTPSYATVDARLAYSIPNSRIQLGCVLQNAFDRKHKEYPVGEAIGRRFHLRLKMVL